MTRTLCFDLDGTLCTNTFGDYEDAVPFPWAIARVNELAAAGNRILVLTARGSATGIDWSALTHGQLQRWGVAYEELHFGKPSAEAYIDDRAVHTDAWRASDIGAPPGGAGELPVAAPADRTAVVEVARTFGGTAWSAGEHATRSVALARAAGLRLVPDVAAVARAIADAVATSTAAGTAGDDLVLTIAHADVTHASLLDTWNPEAPGTVVGARRLSQVAAGLARWVAPDADAPAIRAALAGDGDAWPLHHGDDRGVLDPFGGLLAVLHGDELVLAPDAGPARVEGLTLERLARARGLTVTRRPLEPADLTHAGEALIAGLPFCVLPVAALDGRALPCATGHALLAAWGQEAGIDIAAQTAALVARHHDAVQRLAATR